MMRRVCILFTMSIVLAFQLAGAQSADRLNTVLFKVASPESSYVSYLFGTHHAFGKSFFDSLTKTNQCLANSNVLIEENLNIRGYLAEDIINRRTTITNWRKYLSKEDLVFLEDMFASSPTNFHKMTPPEMNAFLNRYYKEQFCLSRDASEGLTLDDYIGLKAEQQNIELIGLETTEEQIALINKDVEGMPRKAHKRKLSAIIERIRSGESNHCEETDWYQQMEINYQWNAPCRNALVLTDRNNKWMRTIEKNLESNNCFIAVGLSHLMYSCGLIRQLENSGYTISPMSVR